MSRKSLTLCICLLLGSCLLAGCIASDEQTDSAMTKLWRLNLEGDVVDPPLVVQGGVCVVTIERIYLFSKEGDLRWSTPYEDNAGLSPATDGTSLFIAYYDEGILEKRSCETGDVIWQQSVGFVSSPYLLEDRLYFSWNELVCMDAETGDVIWQNPESGSGGFSTMVPFGDTILADTSHGDILVIDPDTGAVLDLWDEYYGMGNMVVHEGLVYTMGVSIMCLDASGALKWELDLEQYGPRVPPAVSYPYLFSVDWGSSRNDTVTCVDMRTGEITWTAPARFGASDPTCCIDNPACIVVAGSLLIAESPTSPGRILVMDIATGEVLDSLQTKDSAMDFAADGTLLYCVSGNDVACYDLSGI